MALPFEKMGSRVKCQGKPKEKTIAADYIYHEDRVNNILAWFAR